ncbi:hypothetical protein CAP31_02270 [Sulfuriferula sp. AH1]|uniref:Hpt domain-containing protein n=1 Tax=Sulfuriferula sp. AH1 TaxID=1985873 RepID=UPI000B3B99BF|nr:Hpt domain-containing protein [Sulfuriferula sp. AH1]ARU30619.1 hypothetical protein CAP31_02270 [Sulfuriferula sp. AH1]
MSLTPEYDIGPLSWVKDEIDRALRQASEILEQYKLAEDDPAKLRQARTYLHQVTGAIAMVGLQGVTLVCQEIEKLVGALETGHLAIDRPMLDLVGNACHEIEHYLDELLNGKPNLELQLLPIYQQLRTAQGITQTSASDLFFPDMANRAPRTVDQQNLSPEELTQLIKKSRTAFQRGLLDFLRQQNTEQGLTTMRSAVHAIETGMSIPASRTFWWGASAFVDCLLNHSIEPTFAVKQLCGRIDLQMRRHIEGSHKIAERLLRDLLYFVAQSRDINEHIAEVKNTFNLSHLIPQQTGSIDEISALRPLLKQLLATVGSAKEAWIKFVSGNQDSLSQFQIQLNELKDLTDTLNNTPISQLVAEISNVACDYMQLPKQRYEAISLEVATALLLIQNNLEHYENISGELVHQAEVQSQRLRAAAYAETDIADIAEVPLLDEFSRQAQEKLLMAQVAQEIQINVQKIEEALDNFFRDNFHNRQLIAELDRPLTEIHGALSIMQLDAANQVLERTQEIIRQLRDPAIAVDESQFPVIADAISSISLYVDAQRYQRQDAASILQPILKQFGLIADDVTAHPDEERVEDELDSLKADLHHQLDAWQQNPDEEDAKKKLVETLREINQDAELVGDQALKLQTAEVLQQINAGQSAQALNELASHMAGESQGHDESRPAEIAAHEIDAELLEIFLEEATEVLSTIQHELQTLAQQPHDGESLRTVRRSFHTLKGSGRMVELHELGETAWSVEQLLNQWLHEEKNATPELTSFLNRAHQLFSSWVDALKTGEPVSVDYAALSTQADQLRTSLTPETVDHPDLAEQAVEIMPSAAKTEPTDAEVMTHTPPVKQVTEHTDTDFAEIAAETPSAPDAMDSGLPEIAVLHEETPVSAIDTSAPEAHTSDDTAMAGDSDGENPSHDTADSAIASDDVSDIAAEPAEPIHATEQILPPTDDTLTHEPADERIAIGTNLISPMLLDIFLREADQHYHTLREEFTRLQNHPHEAVSYEFMRAAHTLAGIAGLTGFKPIAELAHALEGWLNRLHVNAAPLPHHENAADLAITHIASMLHSIRKQEAPQAAPELVALLDKAQAQLSHPSSDDTLLASESDVAESTSDDNSDLARDEVGAVEAEAQSPHITSTLEKLLLPSDEPSHHHITVTDDVDEQLLPIFLEEAADLMPAIEKSIRNWQQLPQGEEQANLQRLLHTLKGSARMAGAMRLGELTHVLETEIIDAITKQNFGAHDFERFEAQIDQLNIAVEQLRNPDQAPAVTADHASKDGMVTAPQAVMMQNNQIASVDAEANAQTLRVRADTVDRLVNEAGEINIARSRLESSVANIKTGTLELNENISRLRAQLRELEIQAESQMQSTLSLMRNEDAEFDPLEFDRFTRLQELTRMIAESVNDIGTVQQNLTVGLNETDAAINQQGRLAKDLQQALMHIRMVPLSSISDRLHRTVRLAAKDLGKKASLQLIGEHVEFDRSVLDKMVAPLEHLLRNSVAHGIEMPGERLAAGKSEYGEIVLYARQEGNEVVIALRDDGRGLDLQAIRAKAISRELISPDAELTADELMQLIFASGFSTAESITTLSGRGVGMDVVKNEISQLGGRIDIASEMGKGVQFSVYLPLTLAVTQTVMVTVGDRLYAISSSMVEQVQEYKTTQLDELLGQGSIDWQGNHYDFFYLPHLLGDIGSQPIQQQYSPVLLLKSGNQRVAILVDHLTGNREIVIKNIGPQLAGVLGIAGATVMGNGQIVLILNPVQLAQRQGAQVRQRISRTPMAAVDQMTTAKTVMVVDDSLTVRKITTRMLVREGYEVITAKDGVDALQILQNTLPDLMLLDIEMPRMDGFELTKVMRADHRLAHIPIIMITSRTADKHREHAMNLGVNAYLGKPFQEDVVLAKIVELTDKAYAA